MKERKIGEEFEVKLRFKVVESVEPCMGCIFEHLEICPSNKMFGTCNDYERSDKKDVHFKLVSCSEDIKETETK